jgi:2,5-diketo-D-gluconate reductase A
MSDPSQVPTVPLRDGAQIPQLGFGVYQVAPDQARAVVGEALRVGYRSIDTATMYGNEPGVGRAVADSGLPREQVFVTTKLNNDAHGYENVLRAFERSRSALGLDYVDLYLIHWPLPSQDRYVETWQAFVKIQQDGGARSIGVSNFHPAQLDRLQAETGVLPVLNQVELHPYLTQRDLRAYHGAHGIVTEAWSPLARGGALLRDRTIAALADKYAKTPAQIVLRWHLEQGIVAIPKSGRPERIRENFDVFDIDLDAEDVEAISALDRHQRTGSDPDRVSG